MYPLVDIREVSDAGFLSLFVAEGKSFVQLVIVAIVRYRIRMKSIRHPEQDAVSVLSKFEQIDVSCGRKHMTVHASFVVTDLGNRYSLLRISVFHKSRDLSASGSLPSSAGFCDRIFLLCDRHINRYDLLHAVPYLVYLCG